MGGLALTRGGHSRGKSEEPPVQTDREETAIGAADAMAEATSRLRRRGWMISGVTQPLLAAPASAAEDAEAEDGLSA